MGSRVTTSAYLVGFGYAPPATSPEKCAISTKRYAPTLSQIALNFLKSIILEYALPPAIISFGFFLKQFFQHFHNQLILFLFQLHSGER